MHRHYISVRTGSQRAGVVVLTAPAALLLLSWVAPAVAATADRGAHHISSVGGTGTTSPQPLSGADQGGNGANLGAADGCGAYCSTRDGSASHNGNGGGSATGRPCSGCVGAADNKNPPGQASSGGDANNGYECDGNAGVGQGNPAHTVCQPPVVTPPVVTPPVGNPPVGNPPVDSPPVETPPVDSPPVDEPPVDSPPTDGGGTISGGTTSGATGDCPVTDSAPETSLCPTSTALGPTYGSGVLTVSQGGGALSVAGPVRARTSLPFTGDHTADLALAGLVLLTAGGTLTVVGRQR